MSSGERDASRRRHQLETVCGHHPVVPPVETSAKPITVHSNVWIGFDSCVLPGVRIGEGAVVGARSVVTQDVPPYTVVAGNPARVVRRLDGEGGGT